MCKFEKYRDVREILKFDLRARQRSFEAALKRRGIYVLASGEISKGNVYETRAEIRLREILKFGSAWILNSASLKF